MKNLRSSVCTTGRKMAGARKLLESKRNEGRTVRTAGDRRRQLVQFVPGHVHLDEIGQQIKEWIAEEGCFAAEFNTIAIDDGIAMGHDGHALLAAVSRDLIADSVEYMVRRPQALDALSLHLQLRQDHPRHADGRAAPEHSRRFRLGGGRWRPGNGYIGGQIRKLDLIDAMVDAADPTDFSDGPISRSIERAACPTCGSCSGMFTANSMNCLTEALGLVAPRQRHAAGHAQTADRRALFAQGRSPIDRQESPGPTISTTATRPYLAPRAGRHARRPS